VPESLRAQTYAIRLVNAFTINKVLRGVKKSKIKFYRRDTYFLLEYTIPGL